VRGGNLLAAKQSMFDIPRLVRKARDRQEMGVRVSKTLHHYYDHHLDGHGHDHNYHQDHSSLSLLLLRQYSWVWGTQARN